MRVNKQMKITPYIPEKSGFTVSPMKEKEQSSGTTEILYWLCSVKKKKNRIISFSSTCYKSFT